MEKKSAYQSQARNQDLRMESARSGISIDKAGPSMASRNRLKDDWSKLVMHHHSIIDVVNICLQLSTPLTLCFPQFSFFLIVVLLRIERKSHVTYERIH